MLMQKVEHIIMENIRLSVSNYKVTYIFSKETSINICIKGVKKYFPNKKIFVYPEFIFEDFYKLYNINIDKLSNRIYIFNNVTDIITKKIIQFISNITTNIDIKFILLSTEKFILKKYKYYDYMNYIEMPSSYKEEGYFYIRYDNNMLVADNIKKLFISTNNKPYLYEIIITSSEGMLLDSDDNIIISKPCIIDINGEPIDKIDKASKLIVTEINDNLFYKLSQNPNLLYNLSPYDFERVIAKI